MQHEQQSESSMGLAAHFSKRKSFLAGLYPFTMVRRRTGLISSPKTRMPASGTPSQAAMSRTFGMVAETATNRTCATAVCKQASGVSSIARSVRLKRPECHKIQSRAGVSRQACRVQP